MIVLVGGACQGLDCKVSQAGFREGRGFPSLEPEKHLMRENVSEDRRQRKGHGLLRAERGSRGLEEAAFGAGGGAVLSRKCSHMQRVPPAVPGDMTAAVGEGHRNGGPGGAALETPSFSLC